MKRLLVVLTLFPLAGRAETPENILAQLRQAAGGEASAIRGEQFYFSRPGKGDIASCTSCHTPDPRIAGSHVRTRKPIEPLAPGANPERLTDMAKVEKWFRRNCNDVLGRHCTAREKADFAAYLLSRQ